MAPSLADSSHGPVDPFDTWLLHRVAQAVEAGEVSGDLLTELRTAMERARELLQEEGHAFAVRDIAKELRLPVEQVETMLTAPEVQPAMTRELVLRRFVDAWMEGQQEECRSGPEDNAPSEDSR